MALYGDYAVEGQPLRVVEIGLHMGFLNAALAGRLSVWADPEAVPDADADGVTIVARDAFDYADAMIEEFRHRTVRYRMAGDEEEKHYERRFGDSCPIVTKAMANLRECFEPDGTFTGHELGRELCIRKSTVALLHMGGLIEVVTEGEDATR